MVDQNNNGKGVLYFNAILYNTGIIFRQEVWATRVDQNNNGYIMVDVILYNVGIIFR